MECSIEKVPAGEEWAVPYRAVEDGCADFVATYGFAAPCGANRAVKVVQHGLPQNVGVVLCHFVRCSAMHKHNGAGWPVAVDGLRVRLNGRDQLLRPSSGGR